MPRLARLDAPGVLQHVIARPLRLSELKNPVEMFYTYVLLSEKDRKLYVGFTADLEDRMKAHQSGSVQATRYRLPVKLIYYEACLDQSDAVRREKYLKTGFGRRFLNDRLKGSLIGLT